jgi:hypothetical protein
LMPSLFLNEGSWNQGAPCRCGIHDSSLMVTMAPRVEENMFALVDRANLRSYPIPLISFPRQGPLYPPLIRLPKVRTFFSYSISLLPAASDFPSRIIDTRVSIYSCD